MDVDTSNFDIETIGEDVPLLEGMRTTRSIRRLKLDPVPPELIRKVCEAGTFAPSGGNRQPWVFIAVTDPEKKAFVAERYLAAFRKYIEPAFKAAKAPGFSERKVKNMRAALDLAENLHQVPVQLFIAGWTRGDEPQGQALYPAAQNILLACRAVGLGASLTLMHLSHREEIDAMLGLPEDRPSIALIPIGWPRGKYGRPPRRSIDTCLYWDRFEG